MANLLGHGRPPADPVTLNPRRKNATLKRQPGFVGAAESARQVMQEDNLAYALKIADGVAQRIERLIVDRVLKPGQALPSERRLMVKLGVSRSALREGLKVLRTRGMINAEHGRGWFVAALTMPPALTPLMHLLGAQPRTLYGICSNCSMGAAPSIRPSTTWALFTTQNLNWPRSTKNSTPAIALIRA
jgi:DNA-binding transcriptional MocR family regulator